MSKRFRNSFSDAFTSQDGWDLNCLPGWRDKEPRTRHVAGLGDFHAPCRPAFWALVGSGWQFARDRGAAKIEEIGFVLAATTGQRRV
jgi:hypothetical protein